MGFEALLRSAVKRGDRNAAAKWERCVRHALDMSFTYMVSWDIPTPEGSDLFNHAFRATGWMMVSPQNQCMDCLGAIEAPATWRMGVYWKDRRLQDLAKLRFASGCQLLDEEGASGENIQLTNFGNLLDDHRQHLGHILDDVRRDGQRALFVLDRHRIAVRTHKHNRQNHDQQNAQSPLHRIVLLLSFISR